MTAPPPPNLSAAGRRVLAAVRDETLDLEDPYADVPPLDTEADASDEHASLLPFQSFAELAAEVDAAGPRQWLLRGVWPAGDYGVHAAEHKAQKTWNTADLAVAVASGTPWLGSVPVDHQGPVLMFVGEGGKANIVRRIRAVAEARGIDPTHLPLVICARAPRLSNDTHIALMAAQIDAQRPALVTLDPLYLSAGGGNLADLYAMGELLERPQRVCQTFGAALFVVTHFNRKQGTGAARITGAGPAEWGRVLLSATVKGRRTDVATLATDVVTVLEVIGGEVPDQALRVHRRIWADDPDDLDSPLHVETTATNADELAADDPSELTENESPSDLPPAAQKLLEALRAAGGPRSSQQLVDAVAEQHGHGLKRQTASTNLNLLEKRGFAEFVEQESDRSRFPTRLWSAVSLRVADTSSRRGDRPCQPASAPLGADGRRGHGEGDTGEPDEGLTRNRWRIGGDPA